MTLNYVITGATSFIGIQLCREVLRRGQAVTAVCRKGSNGLSKLPDGVDIIFAEMSDYVSLADKIPQADIFINLAWEGTVKEKRNLEDVHRASMENSLDAIRAAAKMGCRLFVESGSQAEYGIVDSFIDEKTECNPVTSYGKAKLEVQKRGSLLANQLGVKYLHLRIFSVFGEEDHPHTLIMSSLDKMLAGEDTPLSNCTQHWNYLYCPDAAVKIISLCEYALERADFTNEIFNLASRDTRVLKEFVEKMKELTGSSSKLLYGAIDNPRPMTLQPVTTKLEKAVGVLPEHQFEDIINLIIKQKRETSK